jgi:hypothetical protein
MLWADNISARKLNRTEKTETILHFVCPNEFQVLAPGDITELTFTRNIKYEDISQVRYAFWSWNPFNHFWVR